MKTTAVMRRAAAIPKTYTELVTLHLPRPIHDQVSYDNAVEVVHGLVGFKLNRDQEDYLELMGKLIEDYETETSPEPAPVPGIASLKFLLAANDLSGDDLGTLLGVDRSIAYRILKGTRQLTAEHIRKLSARFAVSADLLLG